ncbi:M20 family metallopeptidase [Micromonospora craniellae]|uniref:M20/M25/M40 family metallo-hydrolase n=1 Tax=Micromonospora craniellae TaxID=2294034 RepID=A0A372FYU3_9ACTN|nr:M20/M25/M40 family metallo-hydrolase [Micromonospora craniellae]QOC93421.1 M20/M25/M40 family metallo-hydrolase [Micromonospora craniellae]RFS45868.1 M20/M25/M40 family metallo-hydrolase [Micromonospora craniellae]
MSERAHELDRLTDAAYAHVTPDLLREIVVGMVDIASPTGEERELADWAVARLTAAGVDARLQPIDLTQANAVGWIPGRANGRSLLLYAPIDTLTTGNPEEDEPYAAAALRPDMRACATVDGDYVLGLGASNPKGHAAVVTAAVEAIHASGIPLEGDLWLGLGAGGMPTNRRATPHVTRENAGQGVGCSFLLEQGVYPDYALIAKPGWSVSWEEVGLCWFEVVVKGTFSYVGSRHRMRYRNPIVEAGKVVAGLEDWFREYSAAHTAGTVAPQGNIGAMRSGWMHLPAVSPSQASLMVDLRIGPDSSPAAIRREFAAAIDRIRDTHPDLEVSWEMMLSIPGTRTDPADRVVRAAVEAWERATGQPHEPILHNSGATDANILRGRGVPTARIGMDRIGPDAPLPLDFPAGMNVVDIREMQRLTRHVIRTALDICGLPDAGALR